MLRHRTCMRPLTPYEPSKQAASTIPRAPVCPSRAGGQLELDLPVTARPPAPQTGAPAPTAALDRRLLARMIVTILEAQDGRRPTAQVRPLLEPGLYHRLMTSPRPGSTHRTVRSVHSCQPCDDAVEACATVHTGSRAFAVAVRFERSAAGWRCTRFDLLKPHSPGHRMSA